MTFDMVFPLKMVLALLALHTLAAASLGWAIWLVSFLRILVSSGRTTASFGQFNLVIHLC
jgi:hypothetical protein